VVRSRVYRNGKITERDIEPSRVSDVLAEEATVVWLDIVNPSPADLHMLADEFGLHRVVLDAAQERDQRPRVDSIGDVTFLAMFGFRMDRGRPIAQEVHALAAPRYLVTLRYGSAFDIEQVLHRWDQESERSVEGGGFLLHALLDEVVDSYFVVLDDFEITAETIEGRVFEPAGPPRRRREQQEALQHDIFAMKRDLLEFRRRVLPLREVLDLLQEDRRLVTPALHPDFKDLADNVVRTLEHVDNVRELLTSAVNAQLTLAGHELNEVMKKLTSWAGIILVPTLIAGIYGMNFRNMPELGYRFGYFGALAVMAAAAGALYLVFKRRGWL
jgi:magnesium transporter